MNSAPPLNTQEFQPTDTSVAIANPTEPSADISDPISFLGFTVLTNLSVSTEQTEFICFPLTSNHSSLISKITEGLPLENGVILRNQLFQWDVNRLIILSKMIHPTMDCLDREIMIGLIKSPSSETVEFLLLLSQNATPKNFQEIKTLIEAIEAIPNEERALVIEQSLSLIIDSMGYSKRSMIISDMTKMIPSLRDPWVRLWIKMRGDGSSGVHFDGVWGKEEIQWLQTPGLHLVIEKCLPLITDKLKLWQNFGIINTVLAVPNEQRNSFISQALQVLGEKREFQSSEVIEQANLPQGSRDSMVRQVTALIVNTESHSTVLSLMRELIILPTEQRESIVEQALLLMGGKKDDAVDNLIETLAAIPQEKRNSVVNQTVTLIRIRRDCDVYVIKKILEALAEIPLDLHDTIAKQASQLVANCCYPSEIAGIVTELAAIPEEQHDSVVRHTALLTGYEDSFEYVDLVVKAMAAIPHALREAAIDQIPPTTSGFRTAIFLKDFATRNKQGR